METRKRRKHLPGRHDQSSHGRRGANLKPRAGRDLMDELSRDSEWLAKAQRDNFAGHSDAALSGLVGRQPGWTSKGRVVSAEKLDEAIGNGWVQMWRGVQPPNPEIHDLLGPAAPKTISPKQILQKDRTGKWEMGHGQWGNGKFFSVRRTTAETYRGSEIRFGAPRGEGGVYGPGPNYEWKPNSFEVRRPEGLMRVALSPDAKLVDYDDLKAEHEAFLANSSVDGHLDEALRDSSFYAVARGYDGVRVRGRHDGALYPPGVGDDGAADQYIVFNRSALMFEEASDRYDT